MSDPMQEIRKTFFGECDELIETLQDGLTAIEAGAGDAETIHAVFRAVHSIKGGAAAFGLERLVAFAHGFETALDMARDGRLSVDAPALRLFFQCGDALGDLVRDARDGAQTPEADLAPLLRGLTALAGAGSAADDATGAGAFEPVPMVFEPAAGDAGAPPARDGAETRLWSIRLEPAPALYATGNEPLYLLRALRDMGDLTVTSHWQALPSLADFDPAASLLGWRIELVCDDDEASIREVFAFVEGLCEVEITPVAVLPAQNPAPAAPEDAEPFAAGDAPAAPSIVPRPTAPPAAASAATPQATPPATVRVDLERIDRLMNLVGELVINHSMLSQSAAAAGMAANSRIATGLDEFLQLTRDIQDSVMMIRAQPVKSLFQRMARVAREVSVELGKEVRLATEGEMTEIDKTVIERLADPLTHMIRNAVDHGLEAAEVRRAAGKPAEGCITLSAAHKAGRVLIELADDGGGIDRDRVREIAIARGLIAEDAVLSQADIDALLFLPGFSTSDEVSTLSGRGVGMDVVKSAISALGGRIAIASTPGRGTRLSISLPLTLAVLDGMVVGVEEETLVVPLGAIVETMMLSEAEVRRLGGNTRVLQVRGAIVPLYDLGAELGYRAAKQSHAGDVVLLIAREDGAPAALVVDRIEDQRQVVIKGLHDACGRIPGIAAATILGDGQIALILDPVDLIAASAGRSHAPVPTAKAG